MASRRRKQGDAAGGIVYLLGILLVILILLAIPSLTTYILYQTYKKIPPEFPSKTKTTCYLWIASGLQYLGGGMTIKAVLIDNRGINNFVSWEPLFVTILLSIPFIVLFYRAYQEFKGHGDGLSLYEAELSEAIRDRRLDDAEVEKLQKLIEDYGLPLDVLATKHHAVFLDALYESADDLNFSEEELQYLQDLSSKLGIDDTDVDYANEFMRRVEKVKRILQGELEGIEPPPEFIPKRGETVYFYEDCDLFENTQDSAYVGMSISLRNLMPGGSLLNPRIYGGKRIKYESMKEIDTGILAITSMRVTFIGNAINRQFSFQQIIGIDVGWDGIQINRVGKAKQEVFKLGALNKDIAIALLSFLLRGEQMAA